MQIIPFLSNTVAIREIPNNLEIFLNKIYFFSLMFKTSSINELICRGPLPPPPIPVGGSLFFEYELHFVFINYFFHTIFFYANKIQYKYII